MEALQPIGWENDLAFRIAARYGLDFFISNEHSLTERGEYNLEHREPTGPELTMWYRLIPDHLRTMIDKLFLSADYMAIEAIPEELSSALKYQAIAYLNAADFAVARKLPNFEHETRRDLLLLGRMGSIDETIIYVSRRIPQGYFYAPTQRVPELNWRPHGDRQAQPTMDLKIESEVVLGLSPLTLQ